MEYKPHVLLLGSSALMDSVAENLSKRIFSKVMHISSNSQVARELVNSLNPDLIVYELNAKNTGPILTIICEQTEAMHLVIDLRCSEVLLLNSQRKPMESMQDLCDLVSQEVSLMNIKKEVH